MVRRASLATPAALLLLACGPRHNPVEDVPGATSDATLGDGPARDVVHRDAHRYDGPAPPTRRFACTDCPTAPFPEPDATPCLSGGPGAPVLLYPPDGVLLPPNLNVMEVQFTPGLGNTLWEVDFTNGVTDLRVVTRCAAITSSQGRATGACGLTLSQDVWDALVAPNRGLAAVTVTVRGTDFAGACSSTSDNYADILFSQEDIQGGVYYWQSAVYGGTAGRTGGIYLHDFGSRDTDPTPYLESGTSGRCTGCHNLSRDGQLVAYGQDDPDADDEFQDVDTHLERVADHSPVRATVAAGFQSFSRDHSRMLASTFERYMPGGNLHFALFDTASGARLSQVTLPAAGTQPDWSADDLHVVYVQPRAGTLASQGDAHFHGGDLYTLDVGNTVDAGDAGAFGAPRLLLPHNLFDEPAAGDSANYYPSYSPDGTFVLFNHASAGDIFYNRTAQVYLASADGQSVYPLDNLNAGSNLTNSWPRWSPFVQRYLSTRILWVTFSSNRSYGARVENDGTHNCYPPASPSEDVPQTASWVGCAQPQLWMAAVRVDPGEFGSGRDTSWPAFWLPFQNVNSHNHSAQWVTHVVTRVCTDLNVACPAADGSSCCDGLTCDPSSHSCVAACVPENGECPGPAGEACCGTVPCDPISHFCQFPLP